MHRTTLSFSFDSVRRAAVVERSIGVEVDDLRGDRSAARVAREGATVTVEITAADLVALRASQNTWLSLVEVAERVAVSPAAGS